MGPDITFCPAIDAQLKPDEHKLTSRIKPADLGDRSETSWIFELEDDGTVIYSRPLAVTALDGSMTGIEGHNFFEEFLGFQDLPRCRQHFKSFVESNKAAERFLWRRASEAGPVDAQVLMTRGFQTGYRNPTGVVMMEIRAS